MSKAPPSFDFFYNDWIGGVQDLAPAIERHYLRLLIYQWQNGQIPESKVQQMNICGITDVGDWDNVWRQLMHKFQPFDVIDANGDAKCVFASPRMKEDRENRIEKWKKNKENKESLSEIRREAANKRWKNREKHANANNDAIALQKHANGEDGRRKIEDSLKEENIESESDRIEDVDHRAIFETWIAYKTERREVYKPVGLKAAVTRFLKLVGMHGSEVIGNEIERAMSSGWKGYEHELPELKKANRWFD